MLTAVYAIVMCLSVCLCVYVSVTIRYCIKTAKRRITQTTPQDSPMTLVLTKFDAEDHGENRSGSPPSGATNVGGVC